MQPVHFNLGMEEAVQQSPSTTEPSQMKHRHLWPICLHLPCHIPSLQVMGHTPGCRPHHQPSQSSQSFLPHLR